MHRLLLLLIFCGLTLSGCATKLPQYSRAQWLQGTSQTFQGVSVDQAIAATERVFLLADGSDSTFSHSQVGIKVTRWTAPFPSHIWYDWDIRCEPVEGGVKVTVLDLSTRVHAFAVPGGATPHQSLSVIDLYFKRLSYLLKQSNQWYSCTEYKNAFPNASSLDALCSLVKDSRP